MGDVLPSNSMVYGSFEYSYTPKSIKKKINPMLSGVISYLSYFLETSTINFQVFFMKNTSDKNC